MKKLLAALRNEFKKENLKPLMIRLLLFLACMLALFGLAYLAFFRSAPELLPLLKEGDEEAIAAYLANQNQLAGILSTSLLAILQPITIIFPAAPIQIAAGVVYGTWKGYLICHLSYVFSDTMVFILARLLRQRLDRHLTIYSGKLDFLRDTQYPIYMTAMASLMPIVPNGIVPYAAARTRMKLHEFIFAVIVGSFFPVFIMCFIGKQILHGDYLYAAILLTTDVVAIVLLTVFRMQVCKFLYGLSGRIRRRLRREK